MQSALGRLRNGAIVLALAVLLGTLGYHALGDYSWRESLWMVIITISSVGYSERSQLTGSVQLFTVGVIVVGMSAAVYTFTGFFQLVLEGELERTLGIRRMNRQIESFENHVIICGMGRSGRSLAHDLKQRCRDFLIVENHEAKVAEAHALDFPAILGDATEESVLELAGVNRSQALVSVLPSDADNVFITLTARQMNPDLLIIARAEHESTAKKLHQAGAQKVVMPARISAMQMSRMILNPSTADLMELFAESSNLDVELDELHVLEHSPLIGLTVRKTEAHRQHKLLIVAIRCGDGELLVNPHANYAFEVNDIAILMGSRKQIDLFRSQYYVSKST